MAKACTGLQDLASSRHPDVLHPDCSGYNSSASLFLLLVWLSLKKATAALPDAASASQGMGSGHAPFLPTYCSWQRSGTSPGFSNSSPQAAAAPVGTFAPQEKTKDRKITGTSGQKWSGAPAAVLGSHQGAVAISPAICLSFPISTVISGFIAGAMRCGWVMDIH